ncbi:hypothetical protein R5R35_008871 [Gryllus longicercus]|uniref:Uncharacterized protein n=1 Tax=Gryllus longicercus TaxID=2509291 RepID=A0AAN9VCR7_9ORTH
MSRFKNSSCLEVPYHLEEARLSNESLDVSSTARWRRSNSPKGYLYPHRRSDMCLVVKRRRRRVQQGILQVFSADSWTATGVALAAFAGALWLIGRRNVLIEVLDAFIHGSL